MNRAQFLDFFLLACGRIKFDICAVILPYRVLTDSDSIHKIFSFPYWHSMFGIIWTEKISWEKICYRANWKQYRLFAIESLF